MIPVTRPFLPNKKKFLTYVDSIYASQHLTNFGPLHNLLEERLKDFLKVDYLLLVSNGTIALDIAYHALNVNNYPGITTAFSFIATASSMKWANMDITFADIDRDKWTICPNSIKNIINKDHKSIVATHVFGESCNIEQINKISQDHSIKVIYDAAHSFGTQNIDVWQAGHASIISLHATKLFHSIEGGIIIFPEKSVYEKAKKMIGFGLEKNGDVVEVGINAKMSEIHAAMGLCVLDDIDAILQRRENIYNLYKENLKNHLIFQEHSHKNNHSYMPVLFEDENQLLKVYNTLKEHNVFSRRYFYPSLHEMTVFKQQICRTSSDISKRVLCLPIYHSLSDQDVNNITKIILEIIK